MSLMLNIPVTIALSTLLILGSAKEARPSATSVQIQQQKFLSERSMSLTDRYPDHSVNEVFKFNIILNSDYLASKSYPEPQKLNMAEVDRPFSYSFVLKPGQTFAFHDQVLDKYKDKVALTTNSQFGPKQGFKSDGWLYGDGVCHLASLLNWAASDAGLEVEAPTNHDFRVIPDIPKQYGTSIFYSGGPAVNAKQNLYITNNKDKDVKISLNYKDQNLGAKVEEVN